ncbi:MAG: VIT domain-containing protein [Anaerolineales bacterium]
MSRTRAILSLILFAAFSLGFASPVYADGIIIPQPPICEFNRCPEPFPISQLAITYHHVEVKIKDQVAVTHVDQVFRNDNDWTVEGTYIFPIPADAAVQDFTLWIDGEPVEGKVLSREEARRTYEDIVRSLRDPALLEYVDRGAVQASIFPIPAGGERRIELEYSQVLTADNGLVHYRYPLNTEKFSTEPLEDVVVSVSIDSPVPIKAVYSPSHPVDITRSGDRSARVGYEDQFVTPDTDFDLYYSVSPEKIGLNLLTYRDPESDDPDGFFLLMAAPSIEHARDEIAVKDVIFVLDRSGSMDGEKFRQAQSALRYVLGHLNPDDRFNIISFSTSTSSFAAELQGTDRIKDALRWVDTLAAVGSTDINRALLEALNISSRSRPTILIFLTDGLPTEGVTDTDSILENARRSMRENIRLFPFGVGYDVDTFLLDSLALENRGTTAYVTPDQAIDEAVSGFYEKVSSPVLTDLALDFGDVVVFDMYPDPLPDLFAGGQLVLLGRYRSSGDETIELSGIVDGEEKSYRYPEQHFRSTGGAEFLPRLWATRKIGALLNHVRLQGPDEETIDQIVRLSIRYGIVTPYTSYLVTEPMAFGADAREGIAAQAFDEMMAAPTIVSGEKAVGQAAAEAEFRGAEVPAAIEPEARDIVQVAGTRTFRWADGVWTDTQYDPENMATHKVPFLSADYFDLAAVRPDIGPALALGERVLVVIDGQAYEIVLEEETGDSIQLPAPLLEDSSPVNPVPAQPSTTGRGKEQTRQGLSLVCPGLPLPVGLAAVVLAWGRRSR